MNHFEDTWNEAEDLASSSVTEIDIPSTLKHCKDKLHNMELIYSSKDDPEFFEEFSEELGELLLYVAAISKKENINVYAALKRAIDNRKIDDLI